MKSSRTYPLFLLFFCLIFGLSWTSILAQERTVFDIARNGSLQEIEALHQKNPSGIESIDDRGSTPLLLACYRNNEAVAQYLLNHTKNINHNSGMGTALMAAVMANNSNLVANFDASKLTSKGSYDLEGDLTLHGVTKKVKTKMTLVLAGGKVMANCNFTVHAQDYKIEIPSLVKEKFAENIKVAFDGDLLTK